MEDVVRNLGTRIAVVTVPPDHAQTVAAGLVRAGVRSIISFAAVPLRLPAYVYVEYIDITTALDTKPFNDAIGARLTWSAGGIKRTRLKNSGGSYLSSHDMREVLGIGAAPKLDWLEIQWPQPSGRTQRLTDLPIDQYLIITEP